MNNSTSFYVYKAGAGSGKTFNLVKQYLKLAFAEQRDERLQMLFRSILAITFTNKAANEMKERIVATLIDLAQGKPTAMSGQLCDELHLTTDELQRRAKIVQNAVLHHYSDLSVCTIDSFMQRLVRTFARDLKLPLNFNIELDADYITASLVEQLLEQIGTEGKEDLTDVLCSYGTMKMDEGNSYNIERNLQKTSEVLFKEETAAYLQQLEQYSPSQFKEAHKQLKEDNRTFLRTCSQMAQHALDVCHANGVDENTTGLKSIHNWLVKMSDCSTTLPNIGTTVTKIYDSGVVDDKGRCPDVAAQAIVHTVTTVVEGLPLYHTRKKMMACYYDLAALSELQRLRETYYKNNELTDFTEISHKINEVVKESPVPYLYERLGDRYRHFLIDEFQDTSQEQWHNLLPLILNSVAAEQRSLIVGDAKQAIYRFRQGDVRQFLSLAQMGESNALPTDADLALLAQMSETVPLATNYRTRPMVVQFNNRFFAWLISRYYSDNPLLQEIYTDANSLLAHGIEEAPHSFGQTSPAGKQGGCVQLAFCNADDDSDSYAPLYTTAYELILRQQALGYTPGDITVLADNNKTLSTLSACLADHGLRSASSESMLLATSTVVQLLYALLRHLNTPAERMHQLHVLHYMWRLNLVPNNYTDLFYRQEKQPDSEQRIYAFSLQDYLQQQGIAFDRQRLQHLSLYELCEELLRIFPISNKDSMFVVSFLNFVARYGSSHRQSLSEFLDYLERKLPLLSSHTPSDSNAIQLMTVHKSKGLEAPVVIYLLPDKGKPNGTHWVQLENNPLSDINVARVEHSQQSTLFDAQRDAEQQEKEMDRVNLSYVAFTRPKDKLLIVVEDHATSKNNKSPNPLNQQLYDYAIECVNSGLCHKDTETDIFRFGNDEVKQSNEEHAAHEQHVTLENLTFASWKDRIVVANSSNNTLSTQESIQRGVELHDLLALIHHADDLDHALLHYTRQNACSDEHSNNLRRAVEKVLYHPDTARFFAPAKEVKTECSLCYRSDTLRPDRIVMHTDETWVVDFKTGAPMATHFGQVTNYCRAMVAMGYPKVKGYIIYLTNEEPHVVAVN